jgi:hypothetical protein
LLAQRRGAALDPGCAIAGLFGQKKSPADGLGRASIVARMRAQRSDQ